MRFRRIGAVELVIVASLMGCGGSAQRPASPEPETELSAEPKPAAEAPSPTASATPTASEAKPDVPPPGSPLDRVMQAHFKDALLIREAVIAGTPERAADPAKAFSEIEDVDKLPAGWSGFVVRMRDAARRIKDSTSSAQAAAATADLGVSCGMCHKQHGGPKVSIEPAPAADETMASRMKRHVWATERLWEGLFVPSDEAWVAGTKILSTDPFPKEALKAGGVHARSAASDFVKLAAKAPGAKTTDARANLYAQMLVSCGACHQAVKGAR